MGTPVLELPACPFRSEVRSNCARCSHPRVHAPDCSVPLAQCRTCTRREDPVLPGATCGEALTGGHCEPCTEAKLPPLLAQARNFAEFAAAWKQAGFPTTSQPDWEQRVAICESNGCGQFRPSDYRCASCGCFIRIKAGLRAQPDGKSDCPLGLWPIIDPPTETNP